jgi:hypothetical protein
MEKGVDVKDFLGVVANLIVDYAREPHQAAS